jgi:hypothetical protein
MYIFGGHDIREGSLDTLWMLDLNKLSDLEKKDDDREDSCGWVKVETTGKD